MCGPRILVILHKGNESSLLSINIPLSNWCPRLIRVFLRFRNATWRASFEAVCYDRFIQSSAETNVTGCKFIIKPIMKMSSILINIWEPYITSVRGINMRINFNISCQMLQRKFLNPVRKYCRQVVYIAVTAYFI